jgi:hypothetical protein
MEAATMISEIVLFRRADAMTKYRARVPWFQYFEAPIVIDNAAKEVVDNAA